MSVAMKLAYKRDVNDPLVTFCPDTLLMRGDKGANIIELTVMDGSSPADLSGYTAVVMFQRPGDSDKIRCPGSISGNVISVTLLGDCYAYSGQYYASLVLDESGFTRTMLRLAGHVENNGDGPVIDPTGTIPGYEDIARIYAELEEALQQAETAISGANAAAQNANEKAAIADTAAGNANTAAGNANEGAGRANEAASSIEGLTVEASDVAYNQPATAEVSDVEGHKHIAFGLRQGVPGAVPNITFTGETGEPNTDVVVTQSGPPEAPVVNLKIPQGVPGTGNVSSVDGVASDAGGNVALSAVRYVAQTLDTTQKVQARKNIGVDGQIYPCTAATLEAMGTSDLVGIYNEGYRAIKTENNGTVVLLGLASDGSLEWLGCNQSRENLLVNSNFAIAQAGYGGKHGTAMYAADRWVDPFKNGLYSAAHPGITITYGTGNAYIRQTLETPPSDGTQITIAAETDEHGIVMVAGQYTTSDPLSKSVSGFYVQLFEGLVQIILTSGTVTVRNARFLIGSYTPKTLPPWVAPDPVVERVNCMRYYQSIPYNLSRTYLSTDADYPSRFQILYPQTMRITPTVALTESWSSALTNITTDYVSEKGLCIAIAANDTTAYVEWHGTITLSADL